MDNGSAEKIETISKFKIGIVKDKMIILNKRALGRSPENDCL